MVGQQIRVEDFHHIGEDEIGVGHTGLEIAAATIGINYAVIGIDFTTFKSGKLSKN